VYKIIVEQNYVTSCSELHTFKFHLRFGHTSFFLKPGNTDQGEVSADNCVPVSHVLNWPLVLWKDMLFEKKRPILAVTHS